MALSTVLRSEPTGKTQALRNYKQKASRELGTELWRVCKAGKEGPPAPRLRASLRSGRVRMGVGGDTPWPRLPYVTWKGVLVTAPSSDAGQGLLMAFLPFLL